ncbi:von Willebrand factor type A [Thalassoporum mexicanum PCC 7367]|uniref:vWA domain-containing protein n=1 Tax=Thalassoporum mexicanum TaxID=3457544 RepID=UPI00029F9581|nr:VWA domain-containing protein [Pseudanabaena sp. PCC 7367]AFY70435.1 von Willebrand factor type A [Pseudanabaena sp. PCC 7367]
MQLPGGELSPRPLHYILILDCSGSMAVDGKIQALNKAIAAAIPGLRAIAKDYPQVRLLVRAITFADGARWHIDTPTPIEELVWPDVIADGVTDMGKALALVAVQMRASRLHRQALPPVLVLISDGYPTDDYMGGMRVLMAEPWAQQAVKVAIALGQDADHEILQTFIDRPDLQPMAANNPETLQAQLKWSSEAVRISAASYITVERQFLPLSLDLPKSPGLEAIW